jgi:hypothetical protein
MKFFMSPVTLSTYTGVANTTMSEAIALSRSASMSSRWKHFPGVFIQHALQAVQSPIFFFARKTFSVSAPASRAPARNASTMT